MALENTGCFLGFLADLFGIQDEPAKKEPEINEPLEDSQKGKDKRTDYKDCYQKKWLLTRNEWYAHRKLTELAKEKNLIICPKVRLLDIIEPRKGEKDYKTLFYKIQAKHVDFVICDEGMKVLAVLELDDSSHDNKDRKSRDSFVDEVLKSCGYKVIHTRYINENTLDGLTAAQEPQN